jgi:hypothetical protein
MFQLVIDCRDPEVMVAFWSQALRYVPAVPPPPATTWREHYLALGVPAEELGDGDCTDRIVDPSGDGPPIWFQPVPEAKTQKNRWHIDLLVTDGGPLVRRRALVDAEVARLVAAGASVVGPSPGAAELGRYAVRVHDPEGNELCVA